MILSEFAVISAIFGFSSLSMNQYFKIGKIAGTHGVEGKVVLVHSLGKQTDLKGLRAIFIEHLKDQFMPYFVEESSAKNNSEIFLKLEDINTKEAARKILKKEVWLPEKDFETFSSGSAPISLLGYTLFDGDERVGEIEEVFEQAHQILCKVTIDGKEALIPVHEDSFRESDPKKKTISVQLPSGLLDIYKNS